MTWIKICGTTNLEDALTAVEAGADALGFVFYDKSPRKIDPETARAIVGKLPANIEKVGVFVNESVEGIKKTVDQVGLTAVQLHGVEDADSVVDRIISNGRPRIFLVFSASALSNSVGYHIGAGKIVSAVFIDSGTSTKPGGTGRTFDWEKAAPHVAFLSKEVNVAVAGGLTPTNVAEAIRILKPWGVDVASGVEASPGKKDPGKIRAFVAAVRSVEKNS